MFFFQRCWFPLFFICHSSSFSVIQVNVDVKLLWKERVLSFTTYAFSCCISPLYFFVLFLGLKTIKNSSFYGGNVLHVLVLFFLFFRYPSFPPWSPLAFPIISPPLQNFHAVLPTKKNVSLLSLAIAVCRFYLVELRWPGAYCLVFSFFLL